MQAATLVTLHDRFSRGEALSDDERSLLEAWYAEQDRAEQGTLPLSPASDPTAHLQDQIAQTAHQLEVITQQITATLTANESLRQEIAGLHARLVHQGAGRAA
ncbi:hypothetical protein EYB53_023770 [Candidatus Chloroploca sp. M-50]|uniref:Uncharacterized protein n=2 Tax=Candidatus Chloroploca TaxID=1579476 RepID=A0A2H3KRD7_9CHLR|nr:MULTISPECIES: hypothetical protein [Candidatus Chloroploca]MBP1468754.1 hypothetical protein [Candidatus Chloroploca mongolica]PDV97765.1 hypothetical protein A9Q02_17630 [Candidatus Chloroploca asiatica]